MEYSILEATTKRARETCYQLRYELLRKPWGQPPPEEPSDATAVHLLAMDKDGVPVGTCRLHFNAHAQGQLRFMAVVPEVRGKGVGKRLLNTVEKKARAEGCIEMILYARANAVSFYEQEGYSVVRPAHRLWGELQHFLMRSSLY